MSHSIHYPGYLITLEGIDGSGKSSLALFLAEQLRAQNYHVLLTREPGATCLGKKLRELIQEKSCTLYSEAEFLLFAADRAQHIQELVLPALKAGIIIISDRMADSSLAYQAFGRGLDRQIVTTINTWTLQNITPNITLYIKIDYKTAFERVIQRNQALTTFEQEKKEFFDRVIHGFDTIFQDKSHVVILDGKQSFDAISAQALELVRTKIIKHYDTTKNS